MLSWRERKKKPERERYESSSIFEEREKERERERDSVCENERERERRGKIAHFEIFMNISHQSRRKISLRTFSCRDGPDIL